MSQIEESIPTLFRKRKLTTPGLTSETTQENCEAGFSTLVLVMRVNPTVTGVADAKDETTTAAATAAQTFKLPNFIAIPFSPTNAISYCQGEIESKCPPL